MSEHLEPFNWAFEEVTKPKTLFRVELMVRAEDAGKVNHALVKLCREEGLEISDVGIFPEEGQEVTPTDSGSDESPKS